MKRGPAFTADDFEQIAREFDLPSRDGENAAAYADAKARVQEDVQSAKRSGVVITPTFFINGRRYEGPWDENTLAEAMLGTLGHRLHAATLDFVRWAPSAGFLLLTMSILAVVLANSPLGAAFAALWETPLGVQIGGGGFTLPLLKWINDGLLAIFFLFVGLEIKQEFTVGRLATLRSGALPVIAAFGGIAVPIIIYLLIAPPGPMAAGWGVPIATDTAFAVAIMVLLGPRVSVELRVFLTAAVIIDDLVAIGVIAVFYTDAINPQLPDCRRARDRSSGRAQPLGHIQPTALRRARRRALDLSARRRPARHPRGRDPRTRHAHASSGELPRIALAGGNDSAVRIETRGRSLDATRPVRACAARA